MRIDNHKDGHSSNRKKKPRLSGYCKGDAVTYLQSQLGHIAEAEGLSNNPKMGTIFDRILKFKLKFDLTSLSKYAETHKRGREQDPARD